VRTCAAFAGAVPPGRIIPTGRAAGKGSAQSRPGNPPGYDPRAMVSGRTVSILTLNQPRSRFDEPHFCQCSTIEEAQTERLKLSSVRWASGSSRALGSSRQTWMASVARIVTSLCVHPPPPQTTRNAMLARSMPAASAKLGSRNAKNNDALKFVDRNAWKHNALAGLDVPAFWTDDHGQVPAMYIGCFEDYPDDGRVLTLSVLESADMTPSVRQNPGSFSTEASSCEVGRCWCFLFTDRCFLFPDRCCFLVHRPYMTLPPKTRYTCGPVLCLCVGFCLNNRAAFHSSI